ncbi:MAG TPA: superoxide dismutase [Cu-Zn] SodC2 [Nitrospiraceae bacterium]|jgi:Cu-Zn family superoxide dismutase|nr:superoxide dismutase [Cu-Zn] SodC2 [Nitrospiraceae bacterium]
MWKTIFVTVFVLSVVGFAFAEDIVITVNLVNEQGVGKEIGTVTASDSKYGLMLTPQLSDLTPGLHGFHVHEKPDCSHAMKEGKAVPALAAGGHYDPASTGKHEGPYGNGHIGDLPPLYVAADGKATLPVLAPRLKVADIKGRSLMIHAGGDNYSDIPAPLGGGGARVACGVIK